LALARSRSAQQAQIPWLTERFSLPGSASRIVLPHQAQIKRSFAVSVAAFTDDSPDALESSDPLQ
jgi:hypothetical protein